MTAMQPRSRQEAEILGLPAWQIDTMFPPATGGGLLGGFGPETQGAIDEYAAMDGLLSPPAPDRFWQGGKKFGVKDGLAGLLAAVGDTLTRNSGGEGYAVQGLLGQRLSAMDEMRKRAEQEAKTREMQAAMQAAGLSPQAQLAEQYGFDLPEPEKPPAIGQTLDYYMQNIKGNPEREAAFKEVQSILNPKWITGADQLPYQVNGGGGNLDSTPTVEDGHSYTPGPGGRGNPANWKKVGGGTGNGVGGF